MVSQIFSLSMFSAFLVFILCSSNQGYALGGAQKEALNSHHHTVQVRSFQRASVCSATTRGQSKKEGSLEVVHRHGPCSPLNTDKTSIPTTAQILSRDQSRVNSIHNRLRANSASIGGSKVTIPAKSGNSIGSGNYVITVGLGTPAKQQTVIFDTGSDLAWVQCQPCSKSCYQQQEPILDPSRSSTYKNITCSSAQCSQATGNPKSCSGNTCNYRISYGDGSFTTGFLATDTITLTSSDVFSNFLFGCGQDNEGLFSGSAGLVGLGRDPSSLVSQTASKYGKIFSYCLPTESNTGTLILGTGGPAPTKYTPFASSSRGASFYFITIQAIKVGGTALSISPTVFTNAGTIIDSGTVITRLPPAAYSALRTAFRQKMAAYPRAPALSILDTCYDLSKYPTATLPTISFVFGGNVEVPLDSNGIVIANGPSQVCLAFAGNSAASDIGIYGNVQQQTMQIVYDLAGGRLGFASGACT